MVAEVEEMGGMTQAVANGVPKLRIEEAAARRQAQIDQGEETIVGVNQFQLDEESSVNILSIDNDAVRISQIRKLEKVRKTRDEGNCQSALAALENAARDGSANLIQYAIDAARQRATVGEISYAIEKVFGRYRAEIRSVSGVYGSMSTKDNEFIQLRQKVGEFAVQHGRQPRMLVAKLGQDGHDRGAKVIATAFADLGFDVDIGPLFQTPDEVVRQAIENDVHVVGISSQAAGHRTLVPELMTALRSQQRDDIMVALGGVVPPQDHEEMRSAGVAAIFGPGTAITAAAATILNLLEGEGDRQVP